MGSNSNFSFFQWAREEQQLSRKWNTCLRVGSKWAKMCPKWKCPFQIIFFFWRSKFEWYQCSLFGMLLSYQFLNTLDKMLQLTEKLWYDLLLLWYMLPLKVHLSIVLRSMHYTWFPWSRQVASGIAVAFKKNIISNFKVLNKMSRNLFETAKFRLWKRQNQIKVTLFITLPIMSLWLKFWTIRLAITQSF